jgi:cytidine deaminase
MVLWYFEYMGNTTDELQITITITVINSEQDLAEKDRNLYRLAQQAADRAYAPYSNFLVGAALLLEDGAVHLGNNQENAAYPSGLCAERTAIFGMSANFPGKKIKAIAIAARRREESEFLAVTPCGSCRQVMAEYENKQNEPIRVLMKAEGEKFYCCRSVSDLLPLHFSKDSLLLV